jgi:peptide/nickel transport system permease protein
VVAVLDVYPETLLVAVLTLAFSLAIGLLLGWLAAVYRYRLADRVIVSVALLMASTPQFWIALVGILVFATKLGWLPTSGLSGPESFILPLFTLCLSPVGVLTQVVRGAVIDSLGSSYVMRSRALGLGTFVIATRHVLRNVSIPITTIAGDQFAIVLNGVIIVSSVFALPGLGIVLYNAVLNRDYNLLQAAVLITAVAVLLLNLAIDLLYTVLDPRVRLA